MTGRRVAGVVAAVVAAITAAYMVGGTSLPAGKRGASTPWTVTRTTAGDTQVVRSTGAIPDDRVQQLVEEWRSGSEGDDSLSLSRVRYMSVGADDRVYVFDYGVPEFRMYDSSGKFVGRIGRKGGGPGEFERINGFASMRDGRVVLWDYSHNRMNVYNATGEYITSWPPPVMGFGAGSNMVSTDSGGRLVVQAHVRDSTIPTEILGRPAWFFYDANGVIRDTIKQQFTGAPPPKLIAKANGGMSSYDIPYLATEVAALAANGEWIRGPGSPYVLHTRYLGKPLRIERDLAPVPVSDVERNEQKAATEFGLRQTEPGWQWSGPDIPNVKPAYTRLFTTLDARIVVAVATPSERFEPEPAKVEPGRIPRPVMHFRSSTMYELFAPDGALLGRLAVPRNVTIHALRGNQAWGVARDSSDVEYVVRWRLKPGFAQ